jgi:hydroxyacylglutathione hydrolase
VFCKLNKRQHKQEVFVIIKTLPVGPIMANCFILGCQDTLQAAVIDPGDEADKILRSLAESKLTLRYIINTHGHPDHVGANKRLKDATGAPILIHALDAPMLNQIAVSMAAWGLAGENSPPPDRTLAEGDTITFGNITLTVIHTPGHTPGGISLKTDGGVFVGDTLFAGSVGRTDFPGGNFETLRASIRDKLFALADDVQVYTGHGPATTIGREKHYNPFVGQR